MLLADVVFGINRIHLKDLKVVSKVFEMYHSLTSESWLIPGGDYSLVRKTKHIF